MSQKLQYLLWKEEQKKKISDLKSEKIAAKENIRWAVQQAQWGHEHPRRGARSGE